MANRFKDIIAEELGFPTTQEIQRALRDWNELEQAIYQVDQCHEYQRDLFQEIVEGYNHIVNQGFQPNTIVMHPQLAQDLGLAIDDIVTEQPIPYIHHTYPLVVSGVSGMTFAEVVCHDTLMYDIFCSGIVIEDNEE